MEDGDEIHDDAPIEETQELEEGHETYYSSRKSKQTPQKTCNQRIDELSTPQRRMFLALWSEHAHHLPKEKVKILKQKLQQLYALSPEETAKYFAEIRAESKAAATRQKIKQKLRKYLLDKYQQHQKERAYKLFRRLLKCGISYAAKNPVPPLISIRLRYLADIILEQLCDLRKVDLPNRANPDKLGQFLISVADWMAIAVERLYFAAQMSINEMTSEQRDESLEITQNFEPLATSSEKALKNEETMQVPKTFSGLSEPAGMSTPKKLSLNETDKSIEKTDSSLPFYSCIDFETTIPAKEKSKNKLPNYTLTHMKSNLSSTSSGRNKTRLEIPPFGGQLDTRPKTRKTKAKKLM